VVPAGAACHGGEPVVVTAQSGGAAVDRAVSAVVARLPDFLPTRRWFGGKEHAIERVTVHDYAALPEHPSAALLLVDVLSRTSDPATYFVPLVLNASTAPSADIIVQNGTGVVVDGLADAAACRAILNGIAAGRSVPTRQGGRFIFQTTAPHAGAAYPRLSELDVDRVEVRRLNVQQSNSSVVFGRELILKAFRRTQPGINPEVEILRFLGEQTTFRHVARLLGWAEYRDPGGASLPVGVLQEFVPNDGDGWAYVLRLASRLGASCSESGGDFASAAEGLDEALSTLGKTLAELHLALASQAGVPAFDPEPLTAEDIEAWRARTLGSLNQMLSALRPDATGRPRARALSPDDCADAVVVCSGVDTLRASIAEVGVLAEAGCVKTRHHGDFHLGQTLIGPDGWTIIDFEGEPLRSLDERRAKQTPLRDVAGLLRSLDYAEATVRRQRAASTSTEQAQIGQTPSHASGSAHAAAFADARSAFLTAYVDTVRAAAVALLPARDDYLARALRALEVEKALYELGYELGNRPDWVGIPLSALARLARGG